MPADAQPEWRELREAVGTKPAPSTSAVHTPDRKKDRTQIGEYAPDQLFLLLWQTAKSGGLKMRVEGKSIIDAQFLHNRKTDSVA